MKKTTKIILQAALGIAVVATLMTGRAMAFNVYDGVQAAKADGMPSELVGENGIFLQITNTILYAVGIIAVVMLIWGGVRYIISGGDSKKVTDAKNTILYAILGLVVALLSYAIVNFVLNVVGTGDVTVDQTESTEQIDSGDSTSEEQ